MIASNDFLDFGMSVVDFYGYEDEVLNLKESLTSGTGFYIWLATLFLAGFTPLPFKVFTITSGMIGFNLFICLIICLLSRGLRFFIVSYLSFKLGDVFNNFMKTKAAIWFTILGILIVVIVVYFPEGIMGWLREKYPEKFGEVIDEVDRKAQVELK